MERTKKKDNGKTRQITKRDIFLAMAKFAFLLLVCVFLWISCVSFDTGDVPNPNVFPHNDTARNWCGLTGAWVSYQFFHFMGQGTWVLLLFISIYFFILVSGSVTVGAWLRLSGMAILVAVSSAILALVQMPGTAGMPEGSGGVVGLSIVSYLKQSFNGVGTAIVLLLTLAIGLILAADELVIYLPAFLKRIWSGISVLVTAFAYPRLKTPGRATEPKKVKALPVPKKAGKEEFIEDGDEGEELEENIEVSVEPEFENAEDEMEQKEENSKKVDRQEPMMMEEEEEPAEPPKPLERVEPRVCVSKALPPPKKDLKNPPIPKDLGDWQLPPMELLSNEKSDLPDDHEEQVREKARVLERTLDEFKIAAVVEEIDTGPVVTMFELRIGPGIKVKSIVERSKDLARALKAPSVRVVAPLPGKSTIGIEVPNQEKQPVRLRELIELSGTAPQRMEIPLFLGKDASGNPLITDLTRMPHTLIAGTTGSGKSVCINSLIISVLLTQRPDHVKMIMVDPKMVELSMFKEIPHLMCPVVHDVDRAEAILEWLVQKMEERYAILAEAQVRDIQSYNKLGKDVLLERFKTTDEEEANRIQTRLPYIVLIIDELADLMMVSPKEVELHLARLAQKSRAVGIHMVLATQRPEAKVVTGLIKSNLPSRIAFRVNSRLDSRIVLDQNGAEDLLGQGDMLFMPPGSGKPARAQGTLIDDGELRRVLKYLAERAQPEFHDELMQIGKVDLAMGERDELFDQAVRIVLESQRGSVSLLQRKMGIGYSRASRLIEQMGAAGIVGDYKGSQARECTMTLEEYDKLKSHMNQEVAEGLTD
jgi:DNA segregation ATPase FtsK/SpoIIIE, S-DNA-T family